jgi:murein DD-endopeptidase MepM/ murein hydrolase activator NlpD
MNWRFLFVSVMFSFGTGALIAATPENAPLPTNAIRAKQLTEQPRIENPPPVVVDSLPPVEGTPEEKPSVSPFLFPVQGELRRPLKDSFKDRRSGGRSHKAIDILAETGTPLVAMVDGYIKLMKFRGIAGRYVYLISADEKMVFLYAHLSGYAEGLEEGQQVKRGDLLGYVGDTGNAKGHPHLHLSITEISDIKSWWKGTPINPYPLVTGAEGLPSSAMIQESVVADK